MKATEQYFYVVLFIMLYNVVLTFKSLDETLVYDHSLEIPRAVFLISVILFVRQDLCISVLPSRLLG